MAFRNDNTAHVAVWLVERTMGQLPGTWTWPSPYSSLTGHCRSDSPATPLARLKHAVKILRCSSHELVPSYYSHPVFMQIFKTQLQNFTCILLTFYLVFRQQDSLLGYLVSCSVFITLAYNFAISANLISMFLQLHLNC